MPNDYEEPSNYGEADDASAVYVDVEYGLRLTTDITNPGKPNTLPLFRRTDLEYAYAKDVKRTGDASNEISWERIAHYRPISRPYGETIKSDEGTTMNGLVYATKYLPRADELTAYVDLNLHKIYTDDDGFLDFEPIIMGDQIPTPTPSWTPTMSWTPTITHTITDTQVGTPTPSPTESPDLASLGAIFRELWKDDSPDYFTFKYLNGYFGIRFRYRKYAMDFYENFKETKSNSFVTRQYFGAKHLTGNDKETIFNPFRKIQIYTQNVIVPDTKYDANDQTIEVTEDHMAIDIQKTFGDGSDDDFGSRRNFEAMVRTNAGTDDVVGTFDYSTRNVKRLTETNGVTETQIGYEIAVPFENFRSNESIRYKSDGSDRDVDQYNRFVNKRDTSLPDFTNNRDNRFDCKYYIFEANLAGEIDISNIIIYPSKEEEGWFEDKQGGDGLGTWETLDVPTYSTDPVDIFEHKEEINGEKLYLFTVPTPTPSFTPSPSPTVTITHPTPTPTFTVSPTETMTNTPTPSVTITHPTPTPSPTITKTMRLFNVNEEKGVNIIGTMNIIQRDGSITYADNLFNLGPVFHLELDGNIDI